MVMADPIGVAAADSAATSNVGCSMVPEVNNRPLPDW